MPQSLRLHAGFFNQRLDLQQELEVPDGCGGFTTNWSTVGVVWANITPRAGMPIVRAGNLDHEVSLWIHLRKISGLRQGMRFVLGNRIFLIISVLDPDETGRYLRCQVNEESE